MTCHNLEFWHQRGTTLNKVSILVGAYPQVDADLVSTLENQVQFSINSIK